MGASWGSLGGLLGGLSGKGELRPSWNPLGALLGPSWTPLKKLQKPMVFQPKGSFCCKNTVFLNSWGSYGLAGARGNKIAECPVRFASF